MSLYFNLNDNICLEMLGNGVDVGLSFWLNVQKSFMFFLFADPISFLKL